MLDLHVLVVEDDDTIRRLLVDYLKAHSYVDVDAARDGVEALHKLSTGSYGVMVLDVMMPKMSGVDLLDSLKAMGADHTLQPVACVPRIIVVTSVGHSELPVETIEQKYPGMVTAVYRKPLELQSVAETVKKLLRDAKAQRDAEQAKAAR